VSVEPWSPALLAQKLEKIQPQMNADKRGWEQENYLHLSAFISGHK
jgi:hypothetical protein